MKPVKSEIASIDSADISYDFANTEQNLQRVIHRGIIKEHPRINSDSISVSTESMQSFWSRQLIPSATINSTDWPRCPQSNLGRPYPIIIGSDTDYKEIVLVDEGASSAVIEEVAIDGLELKFNLSDATIWSKARSKLPQLLVTYGKEKMLIGDIIDGDTYTVFNVVTRGYADTSPEVIPEGAFIVEYRPKEQWMVGRHTMATNQIGEGYNTDIIAINSNDDREKYVIPPSWYQVTENETTIDSGGLTYITTKRPLVGYFASTLDNEKILKTSQDDNWPSQTVGVNPDNIVTLTANPVFIDFNKPSFPYPWKVAFVDLPTDTTIALSEGWSNPESLLSNTSDVATFQGDATWNKANKKFATLRLLQTSTWSQTGNILDGVETFGVTLNIKNAITGTSVPELSFFWRGSCNGDPSNSWWWNSNFDFNNDIAQEAFNPPGAYLGSQGGNPPFQSYITTWEEFLTLIHEIYIAQCFISHLPSCPVNSPWGDASVQLAQARLAIHIPWGDNSIWLWDSPTSLAMPNLEDGNDGTGYSANGILPYDFQDHQENYGGLYDNSFRMWFVAGQNGYIAQPAGTINIYNASIRYKFATTLDEFSDQLYRIAISQKHSSNPSYPNNWSVNTNFPDYSNQTEVTEDITSYFDPVDWDRTFIGCTTYLRKNAVAPCELNNIELKIRYNLSTTFDDFLWTDTEDDSILIGYKCGALQSDGPRSYAWLKYRTRNGIFDDRDGIVITKVSPKDLSFGLVNRVSIRITAQIKPHDIDAGTGGCCHLVNGQIEDAAWVWYDHFGSRNNSAYTGVAGIVNATEQVFDCNDSNITLDTLGIQAGDIIYYETDDDNDPALNQGTYVVKWLGDSLVQAGEGDTENFFVIDENETRKWDIDKENNTWVGFAESSTSVKFRIHRPHLLQQTGDVNIQYIDITDQRTDWDADLDLRGNISIRAKLFTDPGETGDAPFYDRDENDSLFRLWQPQIEISYNAGKESIITAYGMDGINSGDDNPVSAYEYLAQNEAGIDSDYFDSDSFDTVLANNVDSDSNTIRKVDYGLSRQMSFKDFEKNMSFYFNWYPSWQGELITAKDGTTPKLLDGTVLTQAQDIKAYGSRTQYEMHDYSQSAQSAGHPKYGHETSATTGWASSTGCAIATDTTTYQSVSGGVASIKCTASGTESTLTLTFSNAIHLSEDYRLSLWLESTTNPCNISFGCGLSDLMSGGTSRHGVDQEYPISSTWKRRTLVIPKDVTKKITTIELKAINIANTEVWHVDDILLERQIETVETPTRQILVSNPIQVIDMGSVGKWGPSFTSVDLTYAHKPWKTTKELTVSGSRAALSLSSQGSQYYSGLQSDYGNVPFPESLSELVMISDKSTAENFFANLQRYQSERWHIEGMSLGHYGMQLEVGDIIYCGFMYSFPQHYRDEKDVMKYFQVLSVSSDGSVSLIEVDDYFRNTLI